MKKLLLLVLVIMTLGTLYARGYDDEMSEEESVIEAKKDLAAFQQYAVQFRFGSNLKVGDRVEYKMTGSKSDETVYELEVTKETDKGVWIVEKFEGNEVHMLVDLSTMTLLDVWGYDEEGNKQEPKLLEEAEVSVRVNDMLGIAEEMDAPLNWKQVQTREDVVVDGKRINCNYIEPENVRSPEKMRVYLSNDIPLLMPFDISLPMIGNATTVTSGFVKNNQLTLKSYIKK